MLVNDREEGGGTELFDRLKRSAALLLHQLNPFNHSVPYETMQAKISIAIDLNEFQAGTISMHPPYLSGFYR